jgi:hypothetical protein
MSAAPDPAELAPSRDLAAYGKRRLFTASVFAWIAACLVCVGLGAAIGRFAPALAPVKLEPTAPVTESHPPPAPSAIPVVPPPAASAPAQAPSSSEPAGLAERVAQLEAGSTRASDAAAEALAAASLSVAAEGSAPFDQDLAAYGRLAPGDPDLRALAPLAALGAPSRATLEAAFPDLASAAIAAVRQPPKDAGLFAKLLGRLGEVVIVRRVGPGASGVDGVLYHAQVQAGGGDLEGALATLAQLPPAAAAPFSGWTAAARRRVEIDRRITQVRARALAGLTGPSAGAS